MRFFCHHELMLSSLLFTEVVEIINGDKFLPLRGYVQSSEISKSEEPRNKLTMASPGQFAHNHLEDWMPWCGIYWLTMLNMLSAAIEAGRQLVVDGEMSNETLRIVSRELMTIEQCVQGGNQYYKQMLDAINVE